MALGTVIVTVFYAVRRAEKRVLPTTTPATHSDSPLCYTWGIGRSRRIFCRKSATNGGSAAISPSEYTKNWPGKHRGSPNTISATAQCRSFLTAARIPINTNGSASTQDASVAFRADFIVRCIRSTNLFAYGWYVVVSVDVPSSDAVFVQSSDTNCLPRSLVKVDGTPWRDTQWYKNARAQVAADMSLRWMASGQCVNRSTIVKR